MVPVVDKNQIPLMPCSEKRARQMIASRKATPFWKKGVFCVRLNVEPSARNLQKVIVGIDPGSKKEGFTVKSKAHTLLNIQADAITWVKKHVEQRRMMRKDRRRRKTPCRACRRNRSRGGIPPSTKARWQWKLRIINWFSKMYPITDFVVEDIKVKSRGQRKWDLSFSPLQTGKQWFYGEIKKLGALHLYSGWETKALRDKLGLKKSSSKMKEVFEAHCVDSWVLANDIIEGHLKPENVRLLCIVPLQFHRRQLHRMTFSKGGKRSLYGGTRSLGLKRGSLIRHPKYGLTYIGGATLRRLTLCSLENGVRVSRDIKKEDCQFLTYSSYRTYISEGIRN